MILCNAFRSELFLKQCNIQFSYSLLPLVLLRYMAQTVVCILCILASNGFEEADLIVHCVFALLINLE
jgi:hypothetical protein